MWVPHISVKTHNSVSVRKIFFLIDTHVNYLNASQENAVQWLSKEVFVFSSTTPLKAFSISPHFLHSSAKPDSRVYCACAFAQPVCAARRTLNSLRLRRSRRLAPWQRLSGRLGDDTEFSLRTGMETAHLTLDRYPRHTVHGVKGTCNWAGHCPLHHREIRIWTLELAIFGERGLYTSC